MQSHRTLAGRDEVLGVARAFREKKLPRDALIYLGTEFTPSGWNARNGEFPGTPGTFRIPETLQPACTIAAGWDENCWLSRHCC
jgi:alpha-glucosidase/alpha-D-xyloside xylohydrolase